MTQPNRRGAKQIIRSMAKLTEYTRYADAQAHADSKALWELFETDKPSATDAYWTAYSIANEHTLPAVLRFCREAPLERRRLPPWREGSCEKKPMASAEPRRALPTRGPRGRPYSYRARDGPNPLVESDRPSVAPIVPPG